MVFLEKVGKLFAIMKEMGNPFQGETRDLYRQDTQDIAHPVAAEIIRTHLERGRNQFQEFMKGLESKDVCKKNKLDFFQSFQRDDTNITKLFNFLADKMAEMKTPNNVIVTKGESVICNHQSR